MVLALLLPPSLSWAQGAGKENSTTAPGTNSARATMAVETVRVRQAAVAGGLAATGNVAAAQEASVSPKTGGLRVTRILAQVGSRVKRNEVMLEFDDDMMGMELAQLHANMGEAEAAAAEARRSAERARKVGESGALSTQQVEQLITAETTTAARVKALGESVKLQRLRLSQAQLLAPDDGIVSARSATLGAVVPAGMEMFRIIRGGRLEWRAEVPAAEMARLAPGTPTRVLLDDGSALPGVLRLVAPTVDPITRQGLVYVDLPPSPALRPGMLVRGEILVGGGNSWVLPQSAVVVRDGFHMVARLDAEQRVRFAKVTVGRRQGLLVEVTGGLAPEASVVARGAALLGEGDRVRVVGTAP
ncbi:efflux RND transporter periplasmic adaptor subunit [Sphaerotilus sp.]|uniref:efflux RND transporter periplasmic adaptor subunit n=1 Tax=Sphaerotilus sp. TaxID=2093942 RepID=UPI002ACEC2B7|nr:efflux RND transporter periplasmic adaptor subunit [Sphaerotilus sp.]MDZ7857508.1 efflux RND transporter periplasmic adaptor subunit [Sphaerotilus sp.]